jgi:hypothetical protein
MKRRKPKKTFVYQLARFGCISTGLVYAMIGVVAMLSFLRLKEGGADEGSLLVFLNHGLVGKIIIWSVILGMLSYIIWRIHETITDPYGYGKDTKGIIKRSGVALSSVADALVALSAVQALLGTGGIQENGQPTAQREMVAEWLQQGMGWIVFIMGSITCVTAVVQLVYVATKAYMERLDIDYLHPFWKRSVHVCAWAGHLARGIILGIMGFFFIKAAIAHNPQYVVNTDKAFDFIGDHVGHIYFIAVAIGTVCYGLFMFAMGAWYDPDKDR